MTSKECDRGRRERAKCDETKWVSTILLVESQYLKLKHGPYEKFFDLIEIWTFTTCYDQSTILTAGHFYFLAKWQNSSKNVPHNQFKPSLQGKLADFRDLLALISSPFFLTSNNVEGVKILMFDRYHGIGPFVSNWSSSNPAWCFIPCQDWSQDIEVHPAIHSTLN